MEILKPLVTLSPEYFIQIFNTFLVFFIINKLLYKPVMRIIEAREKDVQANITEGEQNRAEGIALKKEYEEKVGLAKREGQEIIKQATLRAESKSEELVTEAKQEAAHIKEKANEEIVKERQKAMNDIKSSVSDIALLAAAKVIEKDIDKAKHEELINNFINEVGEAK
ncbi:F0F1 ATP synthase subunit B [Metaclostridioides mangenotii]|jgi:F-type H+-transporting ATPase subunit b|uniref:F0F1 ATP synthase subunit B n=1 Tax=Metaclostridioides mangenotii TaxID=1540 RepID=UPI00056E7EFC|nr:F0F1 ATP synthase subunit B [Clostridioides mangenotii]